jgi:hypothetical protein
VAGFVLDFPSNSTIGGARVTIGNATATTEPNGFYSLTVPAGEQSISIDGESIGPVKLNDRTYRGDLYVHVTGCIARYGTVVDKRTRRPVAGASLSLRNLTTDTDASGWFRLTFGCPGMICLGGGLGTTLMSVSYPNYQNGSFIAGRGVCFVERVDYELEPR